MLWDPHPVGLGWLKPNAWGLYDIIGNVYVDCPGYFGAQSYDPAAAIDPRSRSPERSGSFAAAAGERIRCIRAAPTAGGADPLTETGVTAFASPATPTSAER